MAARRMIAKALVSRGRFLKLPAQAQALYFHLIVNADDDGFVEAFPVMRSIGGDEEDLQLLQDNGFIRIMDADLVTYINEWSEHNLIRQDRKKDSIYKDYLQETEDPEETENTPADIDGQMTDKCQPDAAKSPLRLGKDRLVYNIYNNTIKNPAENGPDFDHASADPLEKLLAGTENPPENTEQDTASLSENAPEEPEPMEKPRVPTKNALTKEFEEIWKRYPRKQGKQNAFKSFCKARKEGIPLEDIRAGLDAYTRYIQAEHIDVQYIKQGSTWFQQRCWVDDYTTGGGMQRHDWDYDELQQRAIERARDEIYNATG